MQRIPVKAKMNFQWS